MYYKEMDVTDADATMNEYVRVRGEVPTLPKDLFCCFKRILMNFRILKTSLLIKHTTRTEGTL